MDARIYYKFVFIVLVYRNTKDLEDFFISNQVENSHTVVVVSHFDDDSDKEFQRIAESNNADIIFIPNRGYGYGNNAGIEHACKKYTLDYLIISNADITIRKFDPEELNRYSDSIIAPRIIAASGRNQNPSEPFKPSRFVHYLAYKAYKGNHYKLIWLYYGWCRLKRITYNILDRCKLSSSSIYSAHGSFIIFPYRILERLMPVYNDKMFLMNEEGHVAKKALALHIRTKYVKDIVIDHKEDGSMSLEYKNEFPLLKQSFMEFYTYWYK